MVSYLQGEPGVDPLRIGATMPCRETGFLFSALSCSSPLDRVFQQLPFEPERRGATFLPQFRAEYRPMNYAEYIGSRPVLFIVTQRDQLMNNENAARAAYNIFPGPKEYIEIPVITHFEMYILDALEQSSNSAAAWFLIRKHPNQATPCVPVYSKSLSA